MTRSTTKTVAWQALKYVLGLSVLVYVLRANWSGSDGNGVAECLQGPMDLWPLVLAGAMGLASQLLTSVRWHTVARAQDMPLSLGSAVRLGAIGYFLGLVLPGSVSGDLSRAILIARTQERRTTAVGTVVVDGLIAFWSLLLLVAVVGSVGILVGDSDLHDHPALRWIVFTALAGTALGVLAFLTLGTLRVRHADWIADRVKYAQRLLEPLIDLIQTAKQYRERWDMIAAALALSLLSQIAAVLSFYFAAQVFPNTGHLPSLAEHFIIVPIGMAIQFGFPAPGGVGGGEYAYGVLYALALGSRDATAAGVVAALVSRGVALGVGVAGYLGFIVTSEGTMDVAPVGEVSSCHTSAA